MTKDIQAALLRACARFISKKLDPIEKRINQVEQKSIEGDLIQSMQKRIDDLEKRQLLKGEKGEPGQDAPAITDDQIRSQVEKYLSMNPPQRGEKGERGDAGNDGQDAPPVELAEVVKELLTTDELHSLVELRVKEEVAKIPAPKDGANGKDGEKGIPGERGEKGDKGDPGADGVGLAGAMIDRDGALIITTTKGEAVKLGVVAGRDGKDGRDGADFTDTTFDYDGERALTIRGRGGDIIKTLPIPIDRGYWRPDMACQKGDIVTAGGSAWLALRATKTEPSTDAKDDWRLFARKGRDGRDGRDGKSPGPVSTRVE